MGFTTHIHEPTIHPWGEPKKDSLWRRIFKRSKKEHAPNPYEPESQVSAVNAYHVPKSIPYDMYATPNSSSDRFSRSTFSDDSSNPPTSPTSSCSGRSHSRSRPPISSCTLASSRDRSQSRSSRLSFGRNRRNSATIESIYDSYHYRDDEQLVLTLTSKYPTGHAADLYAPETVIAPNDKGIARSFSNKSYQARTALQRSYDYRKYRNRESVHF